MGKRKKEQTHQSGISQAEFLTWQVARRGTTNPTKQNNPVWAWLFEEKCNAYIANEIFKGESPFTREAGWCNDRFGQTTTYLPDGRIIYIAGEHEDSYDPDFYIYNDVIVKHPNGELDFYGYPTEVFPPTDFHTATLIDKHIWIIGNLGYWNERKNRQAIPIYKLAIDTLKIEAVCATGESPLAICKHSAAYLPDLGVIQIMGGEIWQGNEHENNNTVWHLNLSTLTWTKKHQQQRTKFQCRRQDNGYMALDMLRILAAAIAENNTHDIERTKSYLIEKLGHNFNLAVLEQLYDFPFTHDPIQHYESGWDYYWTMIDGVKVTCEEDIFSFIVHIEDSIDRKRLDALKKHLVRVMGQLHGKPFVIDAYEDSVNSMSDL